MEIRTPYCLFLGDATDILSIKIAKGIADWRPDLAIGEFGLPECSVTSGIKALSIAESAKAGAKTFVVGLANSGGFIDPNWIPSILLAIEQGMDIASGLHQRLDSIAEIKLKAEEYNVDLIDVRHPAQPFVTGTGTKRAGKRLLTVGTDCSVGKMYTSLAIEKAMRCQNIDTSFVATGQSGIFITGKGVAIDCVISDFIAGAVEQISPENNPDHWDIVEGQGSLFHPAFAGVSIGLLHGAQPDALVLCHAEQREHMRGIPGRALPNFQETMEANLQAARVTNPKAKFIGIAINTSMLNEATANRVCAKYEQDYNLACVDPVRHGVERLIGKLS
jgi:uncharacterized NAD-dependent epimerase/dehydratase family protein